MDQNVLTALLLSLLAGLSTGIGGFISTLIKRKNLNALAFGLSFSAGAMIYVSLVEIIHESEKYLSAVMPANIAPRIVVLMFFVGIGLAALIDSLFPEHIETEMLSDNDSSENKESLKSSRLKRVGLFTALVLTVHNIPEGLATFTSALINLKLGISIALAIAIHNIPEGIAIALPIYHATGSKLKAFNFSLLSGMAEPLGALLVFTVFKHFFNEMTFGLLFATIAGIMIYIAFDELLPTSREYGRGHNEIFGVAFGMLIMAISFLLF